jgi:hypothetical protein
MIEDLKRCITDAQEITSDVTAELKVEAFKIVLSKLIDFTFIAQPTATSDILKKENTVGQEMTTSDDLPVITPNQGTTENVKAIFATGWGKKRRTVTEINKALDANAVPDPKHISTVLGRLVSSKYLLRIKEDDTFVYWRNPADTSA